MAKDQYSSKYLFLPPITTKVEGTFITHTTIKRSTDCNQTKDTSGWMECEGMAS